MGWWTWASRGWRKRPPGASDDPEWPGLDELVDARLQADLDPRSLRWNLWYLLSDVLYISAYFTFQCLMSKTYNSVPLAFTTPSVALHLLSFLLHLARRRFPRLRLPSPQLWYTLSALVSTIVGMLTSSEIQYIMYQGPAAGFLLLLGKPPGCANGSIFPHRCDELLFEGLQSANNVAVKCSFHVIFILGMKQSCITLAFTAVCLVSFDLWAQWPWILEGNWIYRIVPLISPLVFLVIIFIAKWRLVTFERHLTVELLRKERLVVEERIKRCQAEFHIETMGGRAPPYGRATTRTEASVGASSGRFFEVDPIDEDAETDDLDQPLERMARLGQREHWALNIEDIRVYPGQVLGSGGFGVVLVGSCVGMPVAVKVARNLGGDKGLKTLANELRILRHVRHPNIALFHGACIDPLKRGLAIVLELVQGIDLEAFISRLPGNGPENDGTNDCTKTALLLDICCALYYLHSRQPPVVHGDVKPSNMLVQQMEGRHRVKLLDFGLSRLLTIHAGPLGGTGVWMAPEVFRGAATGPTWKADAYSFGCVAYFVATGAKPHSGMPWEVYRHAMWKCSLPPLCWPGTGIAGRCKEVAERCLRSDPDSRPQMAEVYMALLRWPQDAGLPCAEAERESISLLEVLQQIQGSEQLKQHQSKKKRRHLLPPGGHCASSFGKKEKEKEGPGPEQEVERTPPRQHPASPTPRGMRQFMLLETMARWHCPGAAGSCCAFHEALRDVVDICCQLLTRGCSARFFQEMQQDFVLCPRCFVLDAVTNAGDFQCSYCGMALSGAMCAQHLAHPPGAAPAKDKALQEPRKRPASDRDRDRGADSDGRRGAPAEGLANVSL